MLPVASNIMSLFNSDIIDLVTLDDNPFNRGKVEV